MNKYVFVFNRIRIDDEKQAIESLVYLYSSLTAFLEDAEKHHILLTQELIDDINYFIQSNINKEVKELELFKTEWSALILKNIWTENNTNLKPILQENYALTFDR